MMKMYQLIHIKGRKSLMRKEEKSNASEKGKPDLKGTFISVMILGVLIVVSWVGAFALFISR
jgi:flagellar basal body-associated protein FliL